MRKALVWALVMVFALSSSVVVFAKDNLASFPRQVTTLQQISLRRGTQTQLRLHNMAVVIQWPIKHRHM